jgi:DNA-binding GntR family transcriptional regulator
LGHRVSTLQTVRTDPTSRRTMANDAGDAVRRSILTGEIAPGSPLRPAALSRDLGVSSTVMREALIGLANEHLVQADPHRGFRVRALSIEDLRDLTRVRIELEAVALRWSIAAGDLGWEGEVVGALHRYEVTVRRAADDTSRADELGRAHEDLHASLVAGSASAHLQSIRDELFAAAELYRRWTRYRRDVQRDVIAEHRRIAEACLARDADLAVDLMAEHIQRTADLVEAHLD